MARDGRTAMKHLVRDDTDVLEAEMPLLLDSSTGSDPGAIAPNASNARTQQQVALLETIEATGQTLTGERRLAGDTLPLRLQDGPALKRDATGFDRDGPRSRGGAAWGSAKWYILLRYDIRRRLMDTAKLFWSGRSQAVRLPRAFRVDGREVRIRRRGRAIVLEPVPESWAWLDALAGEADHDFVSAVREQPATTERPGLSKVFR